MGTRAVAPIPAVTPVTPATLSSVTAARRVSEVHVGPAPRWLQCMRCLLLLLLLLLFLLRLLLQPVPFLTPVSTRCPYPHECRLDNMKSSSSSSFLLERLNEGDTRLGMRKRRGDSGDP